MTAVKFPSKLDLARIPTPLQKLERLSLELEGPQIWVKRDDLTECAASGNKIRKLEFTIARALARGADILITCGGLQSNHCRATALLGARLGLPVHLVLREEGPHSAVPDGNLLLDYLAGARVSVYPAADYQQRLPELLESWGDHYRQSGRNPWIIPTGASDGTGVWGYINCARELASDFETAAIEPEAIVHATGSGGTQAGLTAGAHLFSLDCPVWGIAVCDSTEYFRRKVSEDLQEWRSLYSMDVDPACLSINVIDDYIGPGYARATSEVFQCIQQVAAIEGLLLDPVYSGKAFYGMLQEITRGRFRQMKNIVFIHTGGIFGLLSQRHNLRLPETGPSQ